MLCPESGFEGSSGPPSEGSWDGPASEEGGETAPPSEVGDKAPPASIGVEVDWPLSTHGAVAPPSEGAKSLKPPSDAVSSSISLAGGASGRGQAMAKRPNKVTNKGARAQAC